MLILTVILHLFQFVRENVGIFRLEYTFKIIIFCVIIYSYNYSLNDGKRNFSDISLRQKRTDL